jgi:hypothetical protein
LLDWLDPAFEEGKYYRRSDHSYFFMSCYEGKQLVDLVQVSSREFGVPFWPNDRRFSEFFRKLGGMVPDVEPMAFPSRNIGGELVENVPIASLLSKLDAGAPYGGWIFGSGLRFYSEKEAEKIPVGFNSTESFAKMDEDGNVANGIRVEVMELKPVEIKKASEERARGEGQTPFGKMVKCDDFVYIFHGKWFAKRGAPVDKTFFLKQAFENKFHEIIVGALTVSPSARRRLRLLPLPILLGGSLGRHFLICSPRVARGLRRKGQRDLAGLGLFQGGEGGAWL